MYVMDATRTNNGSRIAIGYVKLSVSEQISMIYMSNEACLDQEITEANINELQNGFIEKGAQEASVRKETVSFLGKEHNAIKIVLKINNVNVYMVQILDYKLGKYGSLLSCASIGTDTTQDILDLFYVLD